MRIYKKKFYLCVRNRRNTATNEQYEETSVVPGHLVGNRVYKSDVVCEWSPVNREGSLWRLEDGHLPDLQPVVEGFELKYWMKTGLYPCATLINNQ
jgi:hypothetical protein